MLRRDDNLASDAKGTVAPWLIVLAGVIGTAFLTLAPSFVGALVDAGALTAEQAGQVASSHLLGLSVGPLFALLNARAMRTRAWMSGGAAAAALGHSACVFTHGFWPLMAAQFLAGCGGGLIYAAATVIAAGAAKPERVYAQMFIGMMVFGAAGFVVIPLLLPKMGLAMAFGLAAAVVCLLLPFVRRIPRSVAQEQAATGRFEWTMAPVMVLAALFLHYVANSSVWAYLDRIGAGAGLPATVVGSVLAISMLASVLGGLLVDAATRRFSLHRCLIAGIAAIGMATGLLYSPGSAFIYGLAVFLYLAAMTFAVPIFQGLMAAIDSSRRCALYGNLVLMVGQGLGPAVGSQLVDGGSFSTLLTTSICLFLIAIALVAVAARQPALEVSP